MGSTPARVTKIWIKIGSFCFSELRVELYKFCCKAASRNENMNIFIISSSIAVRPKDALHLLKFKNSSILISNL